MKNAGKSQKQIGGGFCFLFQKMPKLTGWKLLWVFKIQKKKNFWLVPQQMGIFKEKNFFFFAGVKFFVWKKISDKLSSLVNF